MKVSLFWFRRDLRLEDNTALFEALKSSSESSPVLPIFIFDNNILDKLEVVDSRVQFIHQQILKLNSQLKKFESSIKVLQGDPLTIWKQLIKEYRVDSVYINRDYEPYGIKRDQKIQTLLASSGIELKLFKDQVVFERMDVLKQDGTPYTVFTPYKNKWLEKFKWQGGDPVTKLKAKSINFYKETFKCPSLKQIGFTQTDITCKNFDLSVVTGYEKNRETPSLDATSYLGVHLRFGTVSIRKVIELLKGSHDVFLSELIWREFFMQILYHFPHVVYQNFKPKYNAIHWRNNKNEFKLWSQGKTGYPFS